MSADVPDPECRLVDESTCTINTKTETIGRFGAHTYIVNTTTTNNNNNNNNA